MAACSSTSSSRVHARLFLARYSVGVTPHIARKRLENRFGSSHPTAEPIEPTGVSEVASRCAEC